MPKRRTKKQKVQTTQRREGQVLYSLPTMATETAVMSSGRTKVTAVSLPNLYAYDVALLKQDLVRTAVNSAVISVVLAAIYFWM